MLARYDPGAGIGWHRDRDVFDEVVGISLGTPATLRFRRRTGAGFKRASLHLAPRSAYLLSGEARHDWEHSIAPGEELRFSITFRRFLGQRRAHRCRASSKERFACGTVLRACVGLLLLCLLLAACSKGPQADLPVDRRGALAWRRMGAGQRAGSGQGS